MQSIKDIQTLHFPSYMKNESSLTVFEEGIVPFLIKRIFVVKSGQNILRGHHAHRQCKQILVCLEGSCQITCEDGSHKMTILLDAPDQGLLIPPTVWASQEYLVSPTVLMVICDRQYEEEDYIRDYETFLNFRRMDKD